MAYSTDFQKFAQQVYLAIKNRYFDEDLDSADGLVFLEQTADWLNLWLDELENVTDQNGNIINWKFARGVQTTIGTVATDDTSIAVVPTDILDLVAEPFRWAKITVSGSVQSQWGVVDPDQLNNNRWREYWPDCEQALSLVNGNILFSRPIRSDENGGTLTADTVNSLTRVTDSDQSVISVVKPRQLMVLGAAKNNSLPDIVQGGLSPSFLQKYNDLLLGAMARNEATSRSDKAVRDNLGYIGGIWFR